MELRRILVLVCGPPVLVGACYLVSRPTFSAGADDRPRSPSATTPRHTATSRRRSLPDRCEQAAERLTRALPDAAHVIVRTPYVLGGNLSERRLTETYRRLVLPVEAALRNDYFDRRPDVPIEIVLFRDEDAFRRFSRGNGGPARHCYAGYYLRDRRRIVVNVGTGSGTLVHELVHALAHADFPDMPEWFDEGLASLHEQCEFTADGRRLRGLSNWRLNYLVLAVRRGRLRTVEELLRQGIRAEHEAVDYAHARYVCLFLQQNGHLGRFYRAFRDAAASDPTGHATLCATLQTDSLAEFEDDFRAWIAESARRIGARVPHTETSNRPTNAAAR